jgi:hypothetical protein
VNHISINNSKTVIASSICDDREPNIQKAMALKFTFGAKCNTLLILRYLKIAEQS